jgi:acetoacetyl-CoA reductase
MKNVLVTGGNRGIGRSIVKKLASLNYNVIYTYKSIDVFCDLDNVQSYKLDVTNAKECAVFFEELTEKSLLPDVLINNAGITSDRFFHKMTYEEWSGVINTNLLALYNVTQPVFINMRNNCFGRIVNISSVNAHKGQVGQVNYCAAKAGVLGFTKALALEGASKGITVNSVSPGYILTDMVKNIRDDIRNEIQKTIPIGRFGTPEEIAHLVAFLVSEDASYINGADYAINGALHIS